MVFNAYHQVIVKILLLQLTSFLYMLSCVIIDYKYFFIPIESQSGLKGDVIYNRLKLLNKGEDASQIERHYLLCLTCYVSYAGALGSRPILITLLIQNLRPLVT